MISPFVAMVQRMAREQYGAAFDAYCAHPEKFTSEHYFALESQIGAAEGIAYVQACQECAGVVEPVLKN